MVVSLKLFDSFVNMASVLEANRIRTHDLLLIIPVIELRECLVGHNGKGEVKILNVHFRN